MHQLRLLMATAALVALPCATRAADAERCEILSVRKEARRTACHARCERRAQEQLTPEDILAALPEAMARLFAQMSLCQELCDNRYAAAMQRLAGGAACGDGQGDPQAATLRCQASLLRVEAHALSCQSRCLHEADAAADTCRERCDAAHAGQLRRALAQPVCGVTGNGES